MRQGKRMVAAAPVLLGALAAAKGGLQEVPTGFGVPNLIEDQRIQPSDPVEDQLFGDSVSLSGSCAVIGAYADATAGPYAGAAYVFEKTPDGWFQTQKLIPSDISPFDRFGRSLDVDGQYIIISAYGDDDMGDFSGSAYIFGRGPTLWLQVQKITASDGAMDDQFGYDVAIHGDRAVVGAPRADPSGPQSGAAYVFERIGGSWVQKQKLVADDGLSFDSFGAAVDVRDDLIIVGAYGRDEGVTDSGAAYIFRRMGSQWEQVAKLRPADPQVMSAFAYSVSISGDVALVGAYGDGTFGAYSGSAYFFQEIGGSWHQSAKVYSPFPTFGDRFGHSVDLNGDWAIIGAHLSDLQALNAGAAFIMHRPAGAWVPFATVLSSGKVPDDRFGIAVAIDEDHVIAGATKADSAIPDSGAAFIYSADRFGDCNGNGVADIIDLASGFSTDLDLNGIPDECSPVPCPGDVNADGTVDTSDLNVILVQFGCSGVCLGDADEDGDVDTVDLNMLLSNLGCIHGD